MSIMFIPIFIPSLLRADFPKNHESHKVMQTIEQKKPDEICVFTPDTTTDKEGILLDRAIEYGAIVAKGALWYVVIGGTVFTIAAGSVVIHMLWQFTQRNP